MIRSVVRGALICTVLLIITSGEYALGQSTPKYSNEFMAIGVGGQAFGMSNAVVAGCDDVTAGYWNPAGLVNMKDNIQLGYMHTNYFSGIANYDYGSLAFKGGNNNALGISFIRMGVDNIPNTIDLFQNGQIDYDRITEFSAVDYGFLFTYSQKTSIEGLSFGGNAKIIRRQAGQFASAWGFGVDAGVHYKTKNKWQFGAVVRDATSTFNAWKFSFTDSEKEVLVQTGNEIPKNSLEITLPRIIAGANKHIDFTEDFSLDAEIDLEMTTDGKRNVPIKAGFFSADPRFGFQAGYMKIVYLRGGIGSLQKIEDIDNNESWSFQPNFGLGLNLEKFKLDYALANVGNVGVANHSHVFSIIFRINASDAGSASNN